MNNNLIIKNARIITPLGTSALKGKEMNQLLDLTGGTVKVTDGVITYAGPSRPTCEEPEEGYEILDAEGRVLLPGFIDSHTHLVFGGYRPEEFIWRMNGESYMSIMQRGGGIVDTGGIEMQSRMVHRCHEPHGGHYSGREKRLRT